MIFVDTGPLVALAEPRDRLHTRAKADLGRLHGKDLLALECVVTEAWALLTHAHRRESLVRLLETLEVAVWVAPSPREHRAATFTWLRRYADHAPDYADAALVVASASVPKSRIWTYDREFVTTWRGPDGKALALAVSNFRAGRATGRSRPAPR